MKKRRIALAAAMAVGAAGAMVGGALVANALWSSGISANVPDVRVGSVRFSVKEGADEDSLQTSESGEALTVVLPGETIAEVLGQTEGHEEPVIWRFKAGGHALGITGLEYTVTAVRQTSSSINHSLTGGTAATGTVLAGSTMKVYRAGTGGDCSAIPDAPAPAEGEALGNVYLFDAEDVSLQAAGASPLGALGETDHIWCVALNWNTPGDGRYVNDVQVTAINDDGTTDGGMAQWHTAVAHQPSSDILGIYRNWASVEAFAEDSNKVKARSDWFTDVASDPSNEPDVEISIEPTVTNVNSTFSPGG